jgi:HK97 gp10 family phage protein
MANIIGLDRLRKKFAALPDVARDAIRQAMEQSAEQIVMMMKSLAPVESGDLQMSISWTWGAAPKGALKIATVSSRNGGMRITIFAGNEKAYYARFVEFGTSGHKAGGKFAGADIPPIPAHPFFFVSFRANRRSAKSRVSRAITKAAKQVASSSQ